MRNKINIVIDGKKVKVDKDTNKTEVLDQMEEVDDFYLPTNLATSFDKKNWEGISAPPWLWNTLHNDSFLPNCFLVSFAHNLQTIALE